ncbi:hypothetical protein ACFQU7_03090 [Pseudoroseomonas wenyumeiae]
MGNGVTVQPRGENPAADSENRHLQAARGLRQRVVESLQRRAVGLQQGVVHGGGRTQRHGRGIRAEQQQHVAGFVEQGTLAGREEHHLANAGAKQAQQRARVLRQGQAAQQHEALAVQQPLRDAGQQRVQARQGGAGGGRLRFRRGLHAQRQHPVGGGQRLGMPKMRAGFGHDAARGRGFGHGAGV